jgi:non-ribosomal peptide synthase protein (TIGR01720 family)
LKEIPIILEGHGREEILPDVNINRTVGWFASMYPVILDMKNKGDTGAVLKDIKEMIRKIPSKGIGYGILRYLTAKENKVGPIWNLQPEIGFNYLGEFHEDRKQKFIHLTEMPQGNNVSLNSEMISSLYILGIVFKGTLKISMNYDPGYYAENQIRELVALYKNDLLQLIDHCTAGKEPEFTLSDYSVSLPEKEAEIVFDFLSKIKLDE